MMSRPATISGRRLEAAGQLRVQERRSQVGEQASPAQSQKGFFRVAPRYRVAPTWAADGTDNYASASRAIASVLSGSGETGAS